MNIPAHIRWRRPSRWLTKRQGSVLLMILFTVTAISIIITPLMQATLTETKNNARNILRMQARNAAESIVEYGTADLKLRWDNQASFPANELINHPLSMPAAVKTWLWNGTVINGNNTVITGGLVPPGQSIFIDPLDPSNQFDPQRGKIVTARNVMVYGKAIAADRNGNITAYACESLQVRDAPLFAHAIFYNMDLEFHPGPAMTISGPVHTNGDLWVVAQTSVTFGGTITTSKNFNVGLVPWQTDWSSSSESSQTGKLVYIPTGNGTATASPYKGGTINEKVSSSYFDSRQGNFTGTGFSNWRELSASRWGGNLQTKDHGVPNQNVIGYNDYVADANKDGNKSDDVNYAYAIIEPNQRNPSTNAYHKGSGENDKFARKAGLIVRVYPGANTTVSNITTSVGGSNYTVSVSINSNNTIVATYTGNYVASNVTLQSRVNTAIDTAVTTVLSGNLVKPTGLPSHAFLLTTSTQGNATTSIAANATESANTTAYLAGNNTTSNMMQSFTLSNGTINLAPTSGNIAKASRTVGYAWASLNGLQRTVDSSGLRTQVYNGTTALNDNYGNQIYAGDVVEQPIAVNASLVTAASGNLSNLIKFRPAVRNPTDSTDMWNGFNDGRRAKDLKSVDIDIGKLRNLLDDHSGNYTSNKTDFFKDPSSGASTYNPTDQYNGIVYVEFPMAPNDSARLGNITTGNTTIPGDKITVSEENWALRLTNAKKVPNPGYNDPVAHPTTSVGRSPGFTLATNNCLYTEGNFNADGDMNTPSTDNTANSVYNSTMPDVVASPDPPVALVADSITVLSGGWINRNSLDAKASRPAVATEVNAAFLTGLVPSTKSSSTQQSGGAHNFPRFLESWTGDTFRYRGSLVALFESEIANEAWSTSYYDPPARQWGFYHEFALGHYPPGSPNARSYHRLDFQFLTKAQYEAGLAAIH